MASSSALRSFRNKRPPRGEAAAWHAGWAAFVAAAALALWLIMGLDAAPDQTWAALAVGVVPALAGVSLALWDGPRIRALVLVSWAAAGGAAAFLTGGVSGPLAAWCLAPVAAAAVLGGTNLLSQAAALSLMAAAVVALAQLVGLSPAGPPQGFDFWLGLLALSSTGVGLGAGLVMSRAEVMRREAVQAQSAGELQALLAEQPDLLLLTTGDGWINGLYGAPPEGLSESNIRDRNLMALAVEPDRPLIQTAVRDARTHGRAGVLFTPQHSPERHMSLDLRFRRDGGMIGLLRDNTESRVREAALEAAKADAESLAAGKSRFLANMSHELRTPLNAIMGFSDIMRAKMFGELPGKYVEYADLIHESGRHLLDLINDVLDMSKIEAQRYELNREILDGREPVAAALRILRLQADDVGVQLRGVLPPRALDIDADRRALKQITINLVSNALKFTPRGGAVNVTAQDRAGAFELVVSDTGVGIAEEDLEKLGRPYEQVGDNDKRSMGTGLGLSLVRAFAELHGGVMTVESRLGEGTAVTVRLPVLMRPSLPGPLGAEPEFPSEPVSRADAGGNVVAFTPQR